MNTVEQTIYFSGVSREYGEFSNFAPFPVKLDGRRWPTTEHYFQAQKFLDSEVRERIRRAKKPHVAARLGRDRLQKLRPDWESIKVSVMRKAVLAKFQQHEELRKLLLSTGDTVLVEHTSRDDYLGDGDDGKGRNMLGRILMEIREQLKGAD